MRRVHLVPVIACCVVGAIAACVGSDPDPVTATPDASNTSSSSGGSSSGASSSGNSSSSSSGDSGTDAGPKRFCETQTAPTGATDFFCADFDGTSFGQGFQDASVTEGGALVKDDTVYASTPFSALSAIESVPAADSYLWWRRGGPDPVNKISLSASIKEEFVQTLGARTGIIALLALNVGPTDTTYNVSFVYAFNQADASNGGASFTGYALMVLLPAQSPSFYKTDPLLATGAFTNVTLRYDGTAHQAEVLYNGASEKLEPYASLTGNLAVTALVGGKSINQGSLALQGKWNFDNVVFSASP